MEKDKNQDYLSKLIGMKEVIDYYFLPSFVCLSVLLRTVYLSTLCLLAKKAKEIVKQVTGK